MVRINPTFYKPALADLLREPGLTGLEVGKPRAAQRARLQAAIDGPLGNVLAKKPLMASACRAGLWLYFDFFEESHNISQALHTVEGSYWHAILHRREPDPDNAKYWFQRVRSHPIFDPLREAVRELAKETPAAGAFLGLKSTWDSFAFVDLCEAARSGQADCEELCLAIQKCEWELLFEFCYQKASS